MRPSRALLIPLVLAMPAAADPPACGPATSGIVACIAGRLCACGPQRGGRMTGERDAVRWDCSILRPACGGGPDTPAMTGDYPENLPSSLGFEQGTVILRPRPRPDRPGPERPGDGRPPWR